MRYLRNIKLLVVTVLSVLVVVSVLIYIKNINTRSLNQEVQVPEDQKVVIDVGEKQYVQSKQETWEIVAWNFGEGQLTVKNDQMGKKIIRVDPSKMKVLIPFMERDKRQQFMPLNQNEGKAWEMAFCNGDEVNVGTDRQGKVILVINIGSRICGSI